MTFLTGVVAPTSEGADGDLFINVTNFRVYGPKATTWPAAYRVLGAPAFLTGTVAPTTEGVNGDMYLDTVNDRLYGPKTAGVWSSFITLGAGVSVYGSTSLTQRIMLRRDTGAQWLSENPILAQGEPGFVTDGVPGATLKIGTGLDGDTWDQLPFLA